MNRCAQCGHDLKNVTTFGTPTHEEHFICACDGREWALDRRTGALKYSDRGTSPE